VELTLAAAALAGLLSFLSPCVLPVVPAYLGQLGVVAVAGMGSRAFVTAGSPVSALSPAGATMAGVVSAPGSQGAASNIGVSAASPSWGTSRGWRAMPNAIAFVLGFGTIFTLLGTTIYVAVGPLRVQDLDLLRQAGGVILILLGLNLMGVMRVSRLMGTWRPLDGRMIRRPGSQRRGVLGGFTLGAIFAIGWTPCIGPTLGAILGLAAIGTSPQVVALLVAYSLGLGVPFIVLALAVDRAPAITRPLIRHGRTIELVGGALVVLIGLAILFDWLAVLYRTFSFLVPRV
jgi:cytochrome c-type biogenesis protein